ncbi:MAG: glucose-1-phosphate thymidylyltransferase RfbA [Tissierellia bacterium]|nr:glucose-1-phosphate thymidylyltransferase RfbA [Tissierellia bacterium]
MRGIILAAGKGTRMYPMTLPVLKPLLPVYDKPMIYYPLSTLMAAGIREILIITPLGRKAPFQELFGDGSKLGMKIVYREQAVQRGIADAFLIGEEFIGLSDVILALGDNIFHGEKMNQAIEKSMAENIGGGIFGLEVEDPRAFGVLGFDEEGRVSSIEEKPQNPKSNFIVPGLYVYKNDVVDFAKELTPSQRGELEITDINQRYLQEGRLKVTRLESGTLWMDAGSADTLLKSAEHIKEIQSHNGLVGSIELAAYEQGWIDATQLGWLGEDLAKTNYGQLLIQRAMEG